MMPTIPSLNKMPTASNTEAQKTKNASMPIYSVCICNYNMGDTIERALVSVLDQLDETYEILVVDDGSSDNSLSVLSGMKERYPSLRVIELPRDKKRQLGETRNFSISQARGKYVILHVDADDEWRPYIKDFVSVFHRIESCLNRDVLVKGWPIQIAKRDFLLQHGPYRNVNRGEDGDMWLRLAAIDSYIPLKTHYKLMERIPRSVKRSRSKTIRDTWFILLSNFRMINSSDSKGIGKIFRVLFLKKYFRSPAKVRLLRYILIFPAYVVSLFQDPLLLPESMQSDSRFLSYCEQNGGTFREIMERHGCRGDLSFLREPARFIFEMEAQEG